MSWIICWREAMKRIDHTQEAERLMEKVPVVKKSLNIPR